MTGFFIVRHAGGSDVSAMFRIYNSNLDEHFMQESVEFFMLQWPRGQFVADSLTSGVTGALSSCLLDDNSASITLFAVDEPFRSRGAGTQLLDAFVRECRSEGIGRIRLEVREENTSAQRFYLRMGFKVQENVPRLYSDGGNGLKMVLDLDHA